MREGKLGRAHDFARITLAGIRLFNGVAALFVPTTLARRLGVDPEANPAALYALPLFGVRTVLIGASCCCGTAECAPTPCVLLL
jgi:hypothetical protein